MAGLSVVEICAGAGGQSLGLHLAGFRHVLAVEIDETAAETLATNLERLQPTDDPNDVVRVGDVADPRVWSPTAYADQEIDLLAGGVPCPPFSVAGKQLGAHDERDLFAWAIQAVGQMRPRAVLLENVRGLNGSRFGAYRQAVVDELESIGYTANWELLEAKDYGVPQLRPRTVLVALRDAEDVPYFEWPAPKECADTVGTTLRDLMGENGFRYTEEWVSRADKIAPTIVGGSKRHGGADLGPTRAKRAWEALWVDAHGVADCAPDAKWDPSVWANRRGPRLTTEMVARIQGWNGPEYEWSFRGRKTSRYRQIGNAFPPPVARAVGSSIAAALRHEGVPGGAPDRKMHDEVYRFLRDRGDWVYVDQVVAELGGRMAPRTVASRVAALAKDFNLESRVVRGRTAYRLGEWRAFQGQADHDRHLAFAGRRGRSQIS